MLIANVQIAGHPGPVDVRCVKGRIAEVGPTLHRRPGEPVITGAGAALLPGLRSNTSLPSSSSSFFQAATWLGCTLWAQFGFRNA